MTTLTRRISHALHWNWCLNALVFFVLFMFCFWFYYYFTLLSLATCLSCVCVCKNINARFYMKREINNCSIYCLLCDERFLCCGCEFLSFSQFLLAAHERTEHTTNKHNRTKKKKKLISTWWAVTVITNAGPADIIRIDWHGSVAYANFRYLC